MTFPDDWAGQRRDAYSNATQLRGLAQKPGLRPLVSLGHLLTGIRMESWVQAI